MKVFALAGIIGPIWFIVLVVVQGVLQPDYSHIAMPISALSAWPLGWLQNLNFFVFATLMAAFALGLQAVIRPTPFGLVGIALLLASSVGAFMAGVFHWVNLDGIPTETPQHVVAAVLTFASAATGLIVLARRMTTDSRWQDLATYVLGTGVVMLMLFIILGAFAIREGTALHQWVGLLQRVLLAVWFPCVFVMASRALHVVRSDLVSPSTR